MNPETMTAEQLQFHYFKMHDYDNDNRLDGVELVKAITHVHNTGMWFVMMLFRGVKGINPTLLRVRMIDFCSFLDLRSLKESVYMLCLLCGVKQSSLGDVIAIEGRGLL